MITNAQRIRLYAGIIIVAVIGIGVLFNISSSSRLADVRLLEELGTLTDAIEKYKQNYWRYPPGLVDLRGGVILTENGFAPGDTILYRGKIPSNKPVTYQSDQENYQLSFTLRKTWPEVGILTKDCRIVTYGQFGCRTPDS